MNGSRETTRRWVQVARILRSRGNKGEVAAELLSDFPARFSSLAHMYLRKGEGEPERRKLQRFWLDRNHPGVGVFHFEGCTNIGDAEKLRRYEVLLPMEERVKLPAGQYFVTDLVGCAVFVLSADEPKLASPASAVEAGPRMLGNVRDVFFPGEAVAGTALLQVETPAGELLIPLAEDICVRIDVAGRRIDVCLPQGLPEINAAE